MTLNELKIGQSAIISRVGGEGALRQHFLDMGVIPGAEITLIKFAPLGDPIELKIHGYLLTLRVSDAAQICLDPSTVSNQKTHPVKHRTAKPHEDEHPGLGEGGRYHVKSDENPLPQGSKLTFALVGNQNSGKTTLFNQLTGSSQHVGNFPGVTVDRVEGSIRGQSDTSVVDLPGLYSLSHYSEDDIVTRRCILEEKPSCIINIVDATNIERNLYLTLQLMELNTPVVLALNMMDELRGNGGHIFLNEMESQLGIPIVPISAAKNEGIDELISHAVHVAQYQEKPGRTDFCGKDDAGGAVHRAVHSIMSLIEDHAESTSIPTRFAATKLIEGDGTISSDLGLTKNEIDAIEHIISQMEAERGLDRQAAIADMRYEFIQGLCSETVTRPTESKESERSRKIDNILTGKYTAIPVFILIMAIVFYLTFNVIGAWLQDILASLVSYGTGFLDSLLTSADINPMLHGLIIDGGIAGVGSVISFLPIIITLFFFLSMLEDSGYMARIAFVMDKLLRKIGLSGRSIVPMLVGFGCTVPAVMSTRTLPSERDRRLTIMLTPFMSCTAKLAIYSYFIAAFFPGKGGPVMIGLYLCGITVGIICALVSKGTIFKGEPVPFVMELPNYRLPDRKNVAHLLWDKAKDFLGRAFTVIFLASIVIWFLQSYDFRFNPVADASASMLASIGGVLAPLFGPMGLDDWRITTSLVTGFISKESVVSTIAVLYGAGSGITETISAASAGSLLVFCLLYTPCVAAVASIRRELGAKWTIGIVVWQCLIAWLCAFITFNIASLFV